MDEDTIIDLIDEGVAELKKQRPLQTEKVRKLENELIVSFTHASLLQEGSTITIEETLALSNLISGERITSGISS